MTDNYKVTCRYCGTQIVGNASKGGAFHTVTDAAKALHGHLKYSCEKAPAMPSRWLDRVVAASIQPVEPS